MTFLGERMPISCLKEKMGRAMEVTFSKAKGGD